MATSVSPEMLAFLAETTRLFDILKIFTNTVMSITLYEMARTLPEEYVMFRSSPNTLALFLYASIKLILFAAIFLVYLFFFGNAGGCNSQIIVMGNLIWVLQTGGMLIMFLRVKALYARKPVVYIAVAALGVLTSAAFLYNGIEGYGAIDNPDGTCLSTKTNPYNVIASYLSMVYDIVVFVVSFLALRDLVAGSNVLTTSKGAHNGARPRSVVEVMLGDGVLHFAAVMLISIVHCAFLTFGVNPVMKIMNANPDTAFRLLLTLALFRRLKMHQVHQRVAAASQNLSSTALSKIHHSVTPSQNL